MSENASHSEPRLLGTYEKELEPAIHAICARGYDTAIVIGAGVRGRCTPADLRDASALRRTDVLVEVHDAIEPGVSQAPSDRFQATHVVEPVAQQPRTLADLPAGIVLEPTLALAAMSEGRGAATTNWLWMRCR